MKCLKRILFILTLLVGGVGLTGFAQQPVIISKQATQLVQRDNISFFVDATGTLSLPQIQKLNAFQPLNHQIPNFGISTSTYWLRFTLQNETKDSAVYVRIANPLLNTVNFYFADSTGQIRDFKNGDDYSITHKLFKNQSFIFSVPLKSGTQKTVYLQVRNNEQITVPVYAGTEESIVSNLNRDDLIFGIYLGVILIMFFYNLFLYYTVNDKSYLYYIFYIFSVGFAQFCLQGYGYRLFWNTIPFLTTQTIYWSGALSGIAVLLFVRNFIHTREKTPFFDKIITGFIAIDIVSVVLALFNVYGTAYTLIDIVALLGSLSVWFVGMQLSMKGFRPARFFIIAWSFFLFSIILYVIKDFGVIPYNLFTSNILLIGSAIEVGLLSFALADKINQYKKEKEESQLLALQASQENERLVREQNIILEAKVTERTEALQQSNKTLNKTLMDLKEAQTQLVEAEKMASLGQLTSGIAHEINNPINFVRSNVKPLSLDIQDLREVISRYDALRHVAPEELPAKLKDIDAFKQEIDLEYLDEEIQTLLRGIEDGANRTAEIVKGLRTFSRLDESDLKEVDIHEGIEATLVLLKNIMPENLRIVRNYGEIPKVECYPGKLNQVFMNILTNGIQAIKGKPKQEKEEFLTITTQVVSGMLHISIKDSGMGMSEDVKDRIFEPFFTTKDVGEGTGLGLSIVFSIIEKHKGRVLVDSELGQGTEFTLIIPLKQELLASSNES